jgi:hypothetical protein
MSFAASRIAAPTYSDANRVDCRPAPAQFAVARKDGCLGERNLVCAWQFRETLERVA